MPPPWFDKWIRVHGADLRADELIMTGPPAVTEAKFKHPPDWQSDPFLDPADPTKISIPPKLLGRYYLRVTIRWERSDNNEFQIADRDGGYFFTYVTKNGDTDEYRLQDTRISAAAVVMSTKTFIHVLWEGNLRRGDYLKLFIGRSGTILGPTDIPISVMANIWTVLRRLGPPV